MGQGRPFVTVLCEDGTKICNRFRDERVRDMLGTQAILLWMTTIFRVCMSSNVQLASTSHNTPGLPYLQLARLTGTEISLAKGFQMRHEVYKYDATCVRRQRIPSTALREPALHGKTIPEFAKAFWGRVR